MRSENASDQLTTASAISAWRAASSPITTVQTNTSAVSCSEYCRHQRPGEQKANIIGWTCRRRFRTVHGQLYGSGRSLKRVRCFEAAVA